MTAHVKTIPPSAPKDRFGAALRRLAPFLFDQGAAMRRGREVQRLYALSDTDLTRLGVTRDRIVAHAYAHFPVN